MVAQADEGHKAVIEQPFLTILVKNGDDWQVQRGRYVGKGNEADADNAMLDGPPVEGLYFAQIEVQKGVDAKTYNGWCFGNEEKPLDITKRTYLTVFVPTDEPRDFKFARGLYLGESPEFEKEAPADGMVAVTVLVRTQVGVKRTDKLETGWVYKLGK
jgi:hypothetical protein